MPKKLNLQTIGMLLKPDRFLDQPSPKKSSLFQVQHLTPFEQKVLEDTIRMGVMASPVCRADEVLLFNALTKLGLHNLASDVRLGTV
ncbi:MAG: hypothetical protein RBT74_17830 [Tenuifilaceae bacterium]|jgi:hypothetical protein|nr:hypothetical protein [Tenuifilaceae bacterium]